MTHTALTNRQALYIALALLTLLLIPIHAIASAPNPDDPGPGSATPPDALQLISVEDGFLGVAGRLYRTATGGASWAEITPPDGAVVASFFTDARTGWAVLTPRAQSAAAPYDPAGLRLVATRDGGLSWDALAADLPRRETDGAVAQAYLHFANPDDGWLVWRFAGSSNFREGALLRTRDGGATWARLNIPIGEPVLFADAQHGWTAGGAAGDALYETADGGESWTRLHAPMPSDVHRAARPHYGLPALVEGVAIFPVTWGAGEDATEAFYRASANTLSPATDLGGQASGDGLLIAHAGTLWALAEGQAPAALDEGALIAVPPGQAAAWSVHHEGACTAGVCRQQARLFGSRDGGRTWSPLPWPDDFAAAPAAGQAVTDLATIHETGIFAGQGFDKCEIATQPQLATWGAASPYRAVNLYIGGISRACANSALSAGYLQTSRAQGWVFIPTWVGLQAPCTALSRRMSADPAVAYQQGLAEGDSAIARAVELELANPDGSGTVIYYDLEYFAATNASCLLATQAFITGWTERVKAAGSQAGVYSTGCVLDGQAGNVPPPDAIWVANWAYPSYSPDAGVLDLYCLSNTLWANQQRLRQYTGGHNETWGGVTLNIDSNVLDGPVALLRSGPDPTATATATETATATPTATATSTATPRPSRLWLPLIRR